jgi:GT2 family glycosyltransferase
LNGNCSLVSVIIANWNGRHFLERCIPKLLESLHYVDGESELIVVDNASTDGSVAFLERRYPAVHIIRNTENRGFSSANNQAFAIARGRYVATLNNDTEVDRFWLRNALEVLESDSGVGSCATQMRFLQFPDLINSTGIVLDMSGIPRDRLGGRPVAASESRPTEVFGPSAGAAVYRKELLDTLGGFDERFFAYYEDVDLAWRARRAGWRCIYVPSSVVGHVYSGTAQQGSGLKAFLLSRNRTWLLLKNASMWQLLRSLPMIIAYDIGIIVVTAIRRRSITPLRGKVAALMGARDFLKERDALPFLPSTAFAPTPSLWTIFRERIKRDRIAGGAA